MAADQALNPTAVSRGVPAALIRYRVMAYVVGVMLALLVFVAIPLKYLAHDPGPVAVIGTAHGFLYMVYLVAAFDLALRGRWRAASTVGVLLAGTIPLLSFFVERRITHRTRAGQRI